MGIDIDSIMNQRDRDLGGPGGVGPFAEPDVVDCATCKRSVLDESATHIEWCDTWICDECMNDIADGNVSIKR